MVSLYLVYIFGVNNIMASGLNVAKMIVVLSMPCAVGAAIPSLLKQY